MTIREERWWDYFSFFWAQLGRIMADRAEQQAKQAAPRPTRRAWRNKAHAPRRHW